MSSFDVVLPDGKVIPESEIELPSHILLSGAKYLDKCDEQSMAFLRCKAKHKDPAVCLEQGKFLTLCAHKLFQKLNTECAETFKPHTECMWKEHGIFWRCRKTEQGLHDCATKIQLD